MDAQGPLIECSCIALLNARPPYGRSRLSLARPCNSLRLTNDLGSIIVIWQAYLRLLVSSSQISFLYHIDLHQDSTYRPIIVEPPHCEEAETKIVQNVKPIRAQCARLWGFWNHRLGDCEDGIGVSEPSDLFTSHRLDKSSFDVGRFSPHWRSASFVEKRF